MGRADSRHGQRQKRAVAVAVLVLALVLRLPWTAPSTADPLRGFAAAFGEHALCLAAVADPTRGEAPAGPDRHADHDAAKCCQAHAAGAIVLPGVAAVSLWVFATPADRFVAPDVVSPGRSLGRAWARAPPGAAG